MPLMLKLEGNVVSRVSSLMDRLYDDLKVDYCRASDSSVCGLDKCKKVAKGKQVTLHLLLRAEDQRRVGSTASTSGPSSNEISSNSASSSTSGQQAATSGGGQQEGVVGSTAATAAGSSTTGTGSKTTAVGDPSAGSSSATGDGGKVGEKTGNAGGSNATPVVLRPGPNAPSASSGGVPKRGRSPDTLTPRGAGSRGICFSEDESFL